MGTTCFQDPYPCLHTEGLVHLRSSLGKRATQEPPCGLGTQLLWLPLRRAIHPSKNQPQLLLQLPSRLIHSPILGLSTVGLFIQQTVQLGDLVGRRGLESSFKQSDDLVPESSDTPDTPRLAQRTSSSISPPFLCSCFAGEFCALYFEFGSHLVAGSGFVYHRF